MDNQSVDVRDARDLTFLGIGAQKAGTTWLHHMLRLHPAIGMPEAKELHFWRRRRIDADHIAAYKAIFAALPGVARGEITPGYAVLAAERIGLIAEHFPQLRILYVLRNPIERAWSQAKMELAREIHRGREVPGPLMNSRLRHHLFSRASLARGDYPLSLGNWLEHFPREQLGVFVYEEDMRGDPRAFLRSCCRHLRVDPNFYDNLSQATIDEEVLPEKEIFGIERLELPSHPPQPLATLLAQHYEPLIRLTGGLLDRDLCKLWLEPYLTVR